MNNYNFIRTQVNGNGNLTRRYSSLQKALYSKSPHRKPTPAYLIKFLIKDLTDEHIQQALDKRKHELLRGLLLPFTDKKTVLEQAGRIAKDLYGHVSDDVDIDDIWEDFCRLWNLGNLRQPRPDKLCTRHNWMIILRRLVRRASYLFDAITKSTNQYVSDRYLQYSLRLRPSGKYKTDNGEIWSYSKTQKYKQFCRCSGYWVRSTGVGELAIDRGLEPLAITITPRPSYVMHSSAWRGDTPEQISGLLMNAFRVFTDSLRHAEIDTEIIRVTESQETGTPHLHLLLFTQPDQIGWVEAALTRAFIDNVQICGSSGIHITHAYDWRGQLNYMLKTLWGFLKYDKDHEDEIMAWAENGCHRRFGQVSTMHKYPSVEFFDKARKGLANIEMHYRERLRDDVKGDNFKIEQINRQLNDVAKSNKYAEFCRAYWTATGTDEVVKRNDKGTIGISQLSVTSQLRVNNQDNYLSDTFKPSSGSEKVPIVPNLPIENTELVTVDTS